MIGIHFYGLMYVVSFFIGWWLLPLVAKKKGLQFSRDTALELITGVAVGVLVGGRLGYVLLYEPNYYFHHLSEVMAIWQGGMSSHGGFLGGALAIWFFCYKKRISFLQLVDIATVPAGIGLALGRLGNFVNGELYLGNWALVDVTGSLLIALVCWWMLRKYVLKDGVVMGMFLVMYSLMRFALEFIRIDGWAHVGPFTLGQLYTVPLFLLGIWLFWGARKQ